MLPARRREPRTPPRFGTEQKNASGEELADMAFASLGTFWNVSGVATPETVATRLVGNPGLKLWLESWEGGPQMTSYVHMSYVIMIFPNKILKIEYNQEQ